jgi:hypothetical protein
MFHSHPFLLLTVEHKSSATSFLFLLVVRESTHETKKRALAMAAFLPPPYLLNPHENNIWISLIVKK